MSKELDLAREIDLLSFCWWFSLETDQFLEVEQLDSDLSPESDRFHSIGLGIVGWVVFRPSRGLSLEPDRLDVSEGVEIGDNVLLRLSRRLSFENEKLLLELELDRESGDGLRVFVRRSLRSSLFFDRLCFFFSAELDRDAVCL